MPDARTVAKARGDYILQLVAADGAGIFLERVERRDEVVPVRGGGWIIDIRFIFRLPDGTRVLRSPTRRGEHEPYLMIEEWPDAITGEPFLYNYDVVLPEYGEHFGFHLHEHEHGRGIYPHRQGHGVPGGHEEWAQVDLDRGMVLAELVQKATEIDAVKSGAVRPQVDASGSSRDPPYEVSQLSARAGDVGALIAVGDR